MGVVTKRSVTASFPAAAATGLASNEASQFLALSQACTQCRSEADFQAIVTSLVRPLFPHRSLLAVIGRIDFEHLEIQRIVSVDHPLLHLTRLSSTMTMRDRPVVAHWLKSMEPLVLQLPDDRHLMSEQEAEEIETFQLGKLGVHGVVDFQARTGCYFSFAGLHGLMPHAHERLMLNLVSPPLGQALLSLDRICRVAPAHGQELTTTERELLHWVAAGRTNRDIAQLRNRSLSTVRNQLHSAFEKLGAANRAEAARLALNVPNIGGLPEA